MGDGVAARGLAEQGDPVRIAAEGRDVALHPAQGLELVQQPEVGRPGVTGSQEAEEAQPVRHRHHDYALFGDQPGRVHDRSVAGPGGIGTAMDPDHDRKTLVGSHITRQRDGEPLAMLVPAEARQRVAKDLGEEA